MQSSQPMDIATYMYHTGLDLFTGQEITVAKHLRDRKLQRALLPFFKPSNDFEVRQALRAAGRADLIGSGCDGLIPAQPPQAALRARMAQAGREVTEGRYVHTIEPDATPRAGHRVGAAPATSLDSARREPRPIAEPSPGHRPHRKSLRKRRRPR